MTVLFDDVIQKRKSTSSGESRSTLRVRRVASAATASPLAGVFLRRFVHHFQRVATRQTRRRTRLQLFSVLHNLQGKRHGRARRPSARANESTDLADEKSSRGFDVDVLLRGRFEPLGESLVLAELVHLLGIVD